MSWLVWSIFKPPKSFALFQSATRIFPNVLHAPLKRKAGKIVISDTHFFEKRFLRMHFDFKARNMRRSHMYHAIFIFTP